MSDFKDYMLYILGLLLIIVPIARELIKLLNFNKRKDTSPTKKPIAYIIFLVITSIFLLVLGIDKINRDNATKSKSDSTIGSLNLNVEKLVSDRKIDSTRNEEFLKRLETGFKIKRDSTSNKPFSIVTYNTKTGNVDKLVIGNQYH